MGDKLDKFWHATLLHPSDYLRAGDIPNGELVVTIADIDPRHGLTCNKNGKVVKEQKPLLRFEEAKPMVLNKTNTRTIAGLYGNELRAWIGKRIVLEPKMVQAYGETVEALRVAKRKPHGKKAEPRTGPAVGSVLADIDAAETIADLEACKDDAARLTGDDKAKAKRAFADRWNEIREEAKKRADKQ
jgi:hypothetical protein